MKYSLYNHCAGDAAMPSQLRKEIASAIHSINIKATRGSASMLRDAFLGNLRASGWSGEVTLIFDSAICK